METLFVRCLRSVNFGLALNEPAGVLFPRRATSPTIKAPIIAARMVNPEQLFGEMRIFGEAG
jgi:hypothetical protein